MHLMEKPLSIKCRAPADLHRRVSRCSIKIHSNSITQNTKCTQVSKSSIAQNASLLLRRGAAYSAKSNTSCKEKHMCRYNIHTQNSKLMRLVEIVPTDNFHISYFAWFRTNAKMNGSACPSWEARRDTLIYSAIVRNWAQCENC